MSLPAMRDAKMSRRKRIVVVGGVAAGASAACRARRLDEDAEIVLLERGPNVSFANCGLPYHIGGEITDRNRLLVQTPQSLNARFDLDVRVDTEVLTTRGDRAGGPTIRCHISTRTGAVSPG